MQRSQPFPPPFRYMPSSRELSLLAGKVERRERHCSPPRVVPLLAGTGGFWTSVRHLQMFLEMRSGGKPSHARGSAGQTSHAPWHGLCRSLKQQNYISDSFSVFILLRSNQKCNIYMIQID